MKASQAFLIRGGCYNLKREDIPKMKKFNKIMSLLLVLAMVLGLAMLRRQD